MPTPHKYLLEDIAAAHPNSEQSTSRSKPRASSKQSRSRSKPHTNSSKSVIVRSGVYTPKQIEKRLASIDPITVRDYDSWLQLGMSVKHAGGEEAFEVWQSWNQRDPHYAGSKEKNRGHWISFDCSRIDGITYRTLDWYVANVGGPAILAQEDFADAPLPDLPKGKRTDGFKLYPTENKRKGGQVIESNQDNVRFALGKLGVKVRYNEFSDRTLIEGLNGVGPHLDDAAMDRLWLRVDEIFHPGRHFSSLTKSFATPLDERASIRCATILLARSPSGMEHHGSTPGSSLTLVLRTLHTYAP